MMAKGIKDWERYKYPGSGKGRFAATYPQFTVILDGIFVIFLNIVREIVDGDIVVIDVFHDLRGVVSSNLSSGTWIIPFS